MSEWQYYVSAERTCGVCHGEGGWRTKGFFHACHVCKGSGIVKGRIALEDALADTEVIKDIRGAIMEMLNG